MYIEKCSGILLKYDSTCPFCCPLQNISNPLLSVVTLCNAVSQTPRWEVTSRRHSGGARSLRKRSGRYQTFTSYFICTLDAGAYWRVTSSLSRFFDSGCVVVYVCLWKSWLFWALISAGRMSALVDTKGDCEWVLLDLFFVL